MKVGVCGFCESRARIYREFDAVEIQNTFYDFVNEVWLKKLRDESGDFEFTIKALQVITHTVDSPTYRRFKSNFGNPENYGGFRDTPEISGAMEKIMDYARILNSIFIVFQTPPSFSENEENRKNAIAFFRRWRNNSTIFGWENRGKWSTNTLREIVEETGIVHVVDPFKDESITKEKRYFRLHGIGGYSYSYTENDLIFLRGKVKDGDYIMFNNTHMCTDARRFREIIHEI